MKTTISAKKMQIPQNFTEYAEKRIDSRLGKFFGDDADAKIVISEYKSQIVLELTVKYNSIIFRAERSAEDSLLCRGAGRARIPYLSPYNYLSGFLPVVLANFQHINTGRQIRHINITVSRIVS